MAHLRLFSLILISFYQTLVLGSCQQHVYSRLQKLLVEGDDKILEIIDIKPKGEASFKRTKILGTKYMKFFKTGMKTSVVLIGGKKSCSI